MQVQISMKKAITVLFVLFAVLGFLCAETSRFHLSPALDVALSAGSVVLVDGNFVWEKNSSVPEYSGVPSVALDDLNFLDKCAVFKYNPMLDKVSTISTVGILLVPSVLVLNGFKNSRGGSDGWTYGLMYAETVALTYGLKELCKNLVIRERPYLYFDVYPSEEISNGDYCRSFLSGHTALAFACATYLTTVLSLDAWGEDSMSVASAGPSAGFGSSLGSSHGSFLGDFLCEYKGPIIAVSYALATTIATTRVLSGNHYITDVLAGAFLGSLCGLVVPLLHTMNSDTFSAHISPNGVFLGVRL